MGAGPNRYSIGFQHEPDPHQTVRKERIRLDYQRNCRTDMLYALYTWTYSSVITCSTLLIYAACKETLDGDIFGNKLLYATLFFCALSLASISGLTTKNEKKHEKNKALAIGAGLTAINCFNMSIICKVNNTLFDKDNCIIVSAIGLGGSLLVCWVNVYVWAYEVKRQKAAKGDRHTTAHAEGDGRRRTGSTSPNLWPGLDSGDDVRLLSQTDRAFAVHGHEP